LHNIDAPHTKSFKDHYTNDTFRHEFGTVKISLPRRSGHTTAALQLLYEYSDSLLFVRKGSVKYNIENMARKLISDQVVLRDLVSRIIIPSENILKNIRPVHDRSFIIFDQADLFQQGYLEKIKMSLWSAKIVVELQ